MSRTIRIYPLSTIQAISGLDDREMNLFIGFAKLMYLSSEDITNTEHYDAVEKLFSKDEKARESLLQKGYLSECGMYPSVSAESAAMAIVDSIQYFQNKRSGSNH